MPYGEFAIRIERRIDERIVVRRSDNGQTSAKSGNPWAGSYSSIDEARAEAERLQVEMGGPTKALIVEDLRPYREGR